ncbi:glycosyltransferase family 39 protein [Cyanobacterium sp. uoEpiScrs1]|uniref:glycosyltransferase family 39 protein n=1 Tax=Cyanobacterium sp. uoEpiScrs1 TaxID=2976343 RepID=UPI00226A009B|nr:glycosyltransferase family 39 protein [Cyanobacterium sp. uoEpiScrs1]
MLKMQFSQRWVNQLPKLINWLLLGLWIVIGGILRFTKLTTKPPWTDEFATMVFSLGNDFTSVPLNQVISIGTLLQPLRFNPDASIRDVISLLLQEDNHPPLYFVLVHLWVKLFIPLGEYVNVWVMRSPSALLGILSIPAIYFLGKITFRSQRVGHISAALMAVSPYGIFLAQEARHYTLAILFVIASLICFMVSINSIYKNRLIPLWLIIVWIFINGLGLSVHYFFGLTLLSEGITIIFLIYCCHQQRKNNLSFVSRNLIRIMWVLVGAISAGVTWIAIIIPKGYGNGMITWIHPVEHILYMISPPFQLLAVWVPMISLLPVESSILGIVILSGLILLLFFIWLIPYVHKGIKKGLEYSDYFFPIKGLIIFIISAISLFLGITYFLGLDITRGARYSFVYFPAVIVLVAVSLAILWSKPNIDNSIIEEKYRISLNPAHLLMKIYSKLNCNGKFAVYTVWFMGFLGSVTVLVNLGYQKYYLPDRLISIIKDTASSPVLITTTHRSLVQTGETMGIALELQRRSQLQDTLFLLVHQEQSESPEATENLKQEISKIPHPLEVWAVNFKAPIDLEQCIVDQQKFPKVNGYNYQRYTCQ